MVIFLEILSKFDNIFSSVSVSTADKQSSKIKILGFLIIALAIETRCFCPPESVTPRSPKMVLYPFVKLIIFLWTSAFCAAAIISSSVASFLPNLMLSSIFSENKKGS